MSESKQQFGATARDVEGNTPLIPPAYDSVLWQWENAKKKSSGPFEFTRSAFTILFGTIGFTIFVGVMLALPVAMIVVGAMNLNNCPVERYVPIWLVVSGVFFAFMQLGYIGMTLKEKNSSNETENENTTKSYNLCNSLVSCFNFAWFIAGNVWVFRIYAPNTFDPEAVDYCDHSVYYFSFWLLILSYIFMILACCGMPVFACCLLGENKSSATESRAAPTTSNGDN